MARNTLFCHVLRMRRFALWASLLLLALTPLLARAAQAQSGDGYDLHWHTVDGGGAMWSEGGFYRLGGTIGQAEAAPRATGGDYTLQGGFWQRHCTPHAVDVSITCTGDRAQLDWAVDSANLVYDIHRSTSPYQTPVATDPLARVASPPWTDDHGTCGDSDVNYYYVVRSVCVGAHADAPEQGEFDFPLVPGEP